MWKYWITLVLYCSHMKCSQTVNANKKTPWKWKSYGSVVTQIMCFCVHTWDSSQNWKQSMMGSGGNISIVLGRIMSNRPVGFQQNRHSSSICPSPTDPTLLLSVAAKRTTVRLVCVCWCIRCGGLKRKESEYNQWWNKRGCATKKTDRQTWTRDTRRTHVSVPQGLTVIITLTKMTSLCLSLLLCFLFGSNPALILNLLQKKNSIFWRHEPNLIQRTLNLYSLYPFRRGALMMWKRGWSSISSILDLVSDQPNCPCL